MKEEHKYHSLDGLRGAAALVVVLLHYVNAFAPFLLGLTITQRHTPLDRLVSTTPLGVVLSGSFAVAIFFVLSGFVLSLSFFKRKSVDVLASSATRRYFRLMFPAAGSVILAFVILSIGLVHSHQAAVITQSDWLAKLWNFPAQNFGQATFQGIYSVFFTSIDSFATYNPVLWTMHLELFGSFLIFMFLALFGKLPSRWLFYGIFSLIFIKSFYVNFIVGMAIADLFVNYPNVKKAISNKVLWALFPVGLFLGSWNIYSMYHGNIYERINLPFFTAGELQIFAHSVGAIIIVLAVLKLNGLARLLETRPFQYLGKISFSLYLTHFIIMGSFASLLFYWLEPQIGYKFGLVATLVPSFVTTFIVADLYTRFVDVPSIALSKRIGNYLLQNDLNILKLRPKLKLRLGLKPMSSSRTAPIVAEDNAQ